MPELAELLEGLGEEDILEALWARRGAYAVSFDTPAGQGDEAHTLSRLIRQSIQQMSILADDQPTEQRAIG